MLAWKDQYGYNFEFENPTELEKLGFGKYIVYTNPQNPYLWKKQKAKGVDMVLHIGNFRIYIEERFHSCFYYIRTKWFQRSTIQRFANYPHTKNDYHIVLTNRPENYETEDIKAISESQGIFIYSIDQLIYLISNLLSVTINQPINQSTIIDNNRCMPISLSYEENVKEALIMKAKESKRLRKLYDG